MTTKPIEYIYEDLVKVLMQDFLFYLPRELFSKEVMDQMKGTDIDEWLNCDLLVDISKGFYEFEYDLVNDKLVKKHRALEANIFTINQIKSEINEAQLNFLLSKYFNQVEFYASIANWFIEQFGIFRKIQEDRMLKAMYQLQSQFFYKHFIDLISHFFKGQELFFKTEITKQEIVLYYLPEIIARLGSNLEKESKSDELSSDIIENTISSKDGIKPHKKKFKQSNEKKTLITREMADAFILESVFQINPQHK